MADTKDRMQRLRNRRRAEGARAMEVWVEMDTVALMAKLKCPMETVNDLIRRAILALAVQSGHQLPEGQPTLEPPLQKPTLSPKKRFSIMLQYGFRCFYCGRSPVEDVITLTIDHLNPKHAGGTDDEGNLVPACDVCNRGKGGTAIIPPA
jgi:hypothetical protein